MSGKAQTNWLAAVLVAVISAAIGFGAVYVITASDDNQGRTVAEATAPAAGAKGAKAPASGTTASAEGSDAARVSEAQETAAAKASEAAVNAAAGPGQAPRGLDGKPLNRGRMATFVFKQVPMDLPDGVAFNNSEGQAIGLDRFAGKVVLMNLWATWCAPCRKEMPDLDKVQAELGGDGFEVVAVSLDRGSPEKAKAFLQEIGVKSLAFYHDPDARLGFKLMAIGMPTTLLIDTKGREIGRLVGPAEWHSDDAKKLIKAVLAMQGS
jgi:thiol-disulfide isomerase/thioredoxin